MVNSYASILPIVVLAVLTLLQMSGGLHAGTYREVTGFGENPSKIKMFLYTPDVVADKPAVLVACHWCHGDAQAIYNGSRYCSLADENGYYVIFPSAISSDGCWDVASADALTHNGGGDPLGIVSMVRYVISTFHADSTRVFAVGVSSGAMMTNVLLGAYPDLFAAGSAFAGVPFGCFAGPSSWNAECAAGNITKSAREWGDQVRAAYPGYSGKRPKIQMWHGSSDEVINFRNLREAEKQWANVLSTDTTPSSVENGVPKSGWTRKRFTNNEGAVVIETIVEQGLPHNLQVLQDEALSFLGLDQKPVGIGPGVMGMSRASSPAVTIVSSGKARGATVTLTSVPGSASFVLYTLSGRKRYAAPAVQSSRGNYTFVLPEHTMIQREPCIMRVRLNGSDAGIVRCILHTW